MTGTSSATAALILKLSGRFAMIGVRPSALRDSDYGEEVSDLEKAL
jgi:hypothetical protein